MRKANRPQLKGNLVFFLIALLVIAADQISKSWIIANLPHGGSIPVLGILRVTHVQNTGAAFGIFQNQNPVLAVTASIGIVLILVFTLLIYPRTAFLRSWVDKPALGLILGGTAGNLVDRLRLGYVTDFIDFGFWPSFNVADSCVTIGITLFAVSLLFLDGAKDTHGRER